MKTHIKHGCIYFILCNMLLIFLSCGNTTYTEEDIAELFKPVTSKYNIEIVYEIDKTFPPILLGYGTHKQFHKIEPIQKKILARYPGILTKALSKYPPDLIDYYLKAVYFAGAIEESYGLRYAGTYDPFRQIIYLVNDGSLSDKRTEASFHHELSSLFLSQHGFFLNPWFKHNPENFQYRSQKYDRSEDVYAPVSLQEPDKYYKDGFLNSYSQTNFENDFNKYAEMIFMEPEKFRKIMKEYPRVRGKFLVWLNYYNRLDPIFTEEYLLGEAMEMKEHERIKPEAYIDVGPRNHSEPKTETVH